MKSIFLHSRSKLRGQRDTAIFRVSPALILLLLLVILVAALGVYLTVQYNTTQNPSFEATNSIASQNVGSLLSGFAIEQIEVLKESDNSTLSAGLVYVAATNLQQEQGFQNATSFGNCNGLANKTKPCIGMMFVTERTQDLCFWMHNTILPLQQDWVSSNGTVSAIYEAQPETDHTVCHVAFDVLETSPSMQISVGDKIFQF